MPHPLPIARPVLFPLYAVLRGECGCGEESCSRVGKHPRVKWGDIKYPGYERPPRPCGYAVKTGAHPYGSDVFVVDADNAAAMAVVVERNGGEPDTFTVATGRGAHYYFQLPDFPVRRSIGELAPKIDIVGEKWWVVGPGSPHKNGTIYTVARDVPPAPCPAWLAEWPGLRARATGEVRVYAGDVTTEPEATYRRAKYIEFCQRAPPSIAGKGGDLALWRVVQHGALDLRLPNDVILAVMAEHFDPRCVPPWGDGLAERVNHKAHSAKTSSTRRPAEPISARLAERLGRFEAAATTPWTPPAPSGPAPTPFNKPRRQSAKGATR
jgi:hypothetical protein